MTYVYDCPDCSHRFDVIKPARDMEKNETCPKCGEFALRRFVPEHVYISGAKVEHAEYNPALGCVTKNSKHRAELAKRKGLVEVGNDYGSGEAMQKNFDTEREKKLAKRYEEV